MSQTLRQLFFSAVSREFSSYRVELDHRLRDQFFVRTQEHFSQGQGKLLQSLDDYIRDCDALVHLVGDACGSDPMRAEVDVLLRTYPRLAEELDARCYTLSYTQWEVVLALHHGKPCFVFRPDPGVAVPRNDGFEACAEDRARQMAHFEWLQARGENWSTFRRREDLALQVWSALARARLVQEPARAKPNNLPRSIGALFQGRDAVLEQIRRSLEPAAGERRNAVPPAPHALHGLGGVGKTRTAVEYGWRHAAEYNALLFVQADSPETLERNLADLVGPLELDLEQQVPEQDVRVAAVLRWLRAHPRWLLILDNVDSEPAALAVEQLVESLTQGHILITSRLSSWAASVDPMELDLLAEDDATAFLLERTARGRPRISEADESAARALARELDGLALALEQAAAYIRGRRITLAAYHERWARQRTELLRSRSPREMQYPLSVGVTWQTSVDQLTAEGRALLEHVAWLAPDPIPRSLLDCAPDDLPDPEMALADLFACSLATAEDESFRIHRLVQQVTRDSLEHAATASSRLGVALHWVNAAFVGDPNDVRSWPRLDPLRAHAEAVVEHAVSQGRVDPESPASWLLKQLGELLYSKALYREAEPFMRRALEIDQAAGPDHPRVAGHLNNLAQLFQVTNRFAEAEPLMRRALGIDEATLGAEHPDVAIDLNNLGWLLQATNRFAEAEPLMRRALEIDEASLGSDHPNVAIDLNNLAQLLQVTGRLPEAEFLMRRALEIDEESLGPEHPNVAIRLNNLAQLLRDTARLSESEPLIRRALQIDEESLGPEHPNVAIRLRNLAQLLRDTDRLSESEPLMRRALQIDEDSLGPEHPNVAIDLNNLGWLLQATGRLSEGEPLMKRAVVILAQFTRDTGHPHPHLQAALRSYGALLEQTGSSPEQVRAVLQELAPEFEA